MKLEKLLEKSTEEAVIPNKDSAVNLDLGYKVDFSKSCNISLEPISGEFEQFQVVTDCESDLSRFSIHPINILIETAMETDKFKGSVEDQLLEEEDYVKRRLKKFGVDVA